MYIIIFLGSDQVKEAEKKAIISGIEHNNVDQADVVIRKVNLQKLLSKFRH